MFFFLKFWFLIQKVQNRYFAVEMKQLIAN